MIYKARECEFCGNMFMPQKPNAVTCSHNCRVARRKELDVRRHQRNRISEIHWLNCRLEDALQKIACLTVLASLVGEKDQVLGKTRDELQAAKTELSNTRLELSAMRHELESAKIMAVESRKKEESAMKALAELQSIHSYKAKISKTDLSTENKPAVKPVPASPTPAKTAKKISNIPEKKQEYYKHTCEYCGGEFESRKAVETYCSPYCQKKAKETQLAH